MEMVKTPYFKMILMQLCHASMNPLKFAKGLYNWRDTNTQEMNIRVDTELWAAILSNCFTDLRVIFSPFFFLFSSFRVKIQ